MEILGNVLIIIGMLFMLFGVIGIFKYRTFYVRILVASMIDSVGAMTVIIGITLRHGVGFFSLRILLLLALMFFVTPMVTHIVTRCAYQSGHQLEDLREEIEEDS